MKTKMMEAFKARLTSLGFDHAIEDRLRAYCCFAPEKLELPHCVVTDDAKCVFSVHCVKGELGMYDALSYTATLVKLPMLTDVDRSLGEQCAQVDWDAFYFFRGRLSGNESLHNCTVAVELVNRLMEKDVSGSLRFRHWVGTALETFIPNLAAFKASYEISQRFYLADQSDPVTFAEAVRFLQSKWTERRMLADRKALLKQPASAGGKGAERLLTKRVRPGRNRDNQFQ